ncbi:MAG: GNAT family N-acetyltransferase [bacterium]
MEEARDAVEVRSVEAEEIEAWDRAKAVTFQGDPREVTGPRVELRRRAWDPARAWGAFAGSAVVGTLRTLPRRFTVPGPDDATVDLAQVDALTAVTVSATHRRRGLLRRMLTESLTAAAERGDPMSILIAAEWNIYGRFGYAPASAWSNWTLDRRRPGAALRPEIPVRGVLRPAEAKELLDVAPPVFDLARRQRAGQIDRPSDVWQFFLDPQLHTGGSKSSIGIVHEGQDGVDGVLAWHTGTEFDFDRGGTIVVEDFFAANQDAYTALWSYLLAMDVVDEVTFDARPPDEPIRHLLVDGRCLRTAKSLDAVWVRLLDIPAALSTRHYSTEGALVLDVVDEQVGRFAAGRYRLAGGPDGATCVRAPQASPDLRLSQRAMAAVYLGLPSLRAQQIAGRVDELTPGAVARADAMFITGWQPWLATGF